MKCALYARISVEDKNKPQYSIDAQIARLKKFANENNYTIYDIYVDNGISAATIKKRKALLKLIDDSDNFDILLFTQLDRFSRNVLDANNLVQIFNQKNVMIKAIDEDDIDTSTADGKFIFDLKVSLAERERKKVSEREKAANAYKLTQKKALYGNAGRGFKLDENKHWILSDEAPMIYDMFRLYIDTGNRVTICKEIYKKYGIQFTPGDISHYLKQERYTGRYKGIVDYFPRIVPEDMWLLTCKMRKERRIKKELTYAYIFRGLVRCAYCGHIMVGCTRKDEPNSKRKEHHFYKCSRKDQNKPDHSYCDVRFQISERYIENYLLNNLTDLFKSYQLEIEQQNDFKPIDESKIKDKISRLQDLYVEGLIDKAKYLKDYSSLNEELVNAEKHNSNQPKIDLEKLKKQLNKYNREWYNQADNQQKWAFWNNLIDSIIVDKEKNISIIFKK